MWQHVIIILFTSVCIDIFIRPQLLGSMVRFSADSSKMDPTKIKKHQNHFIFLYPPDSDISLELLVPHKWFIYQYLQYLTRNTAKIELKGPTQKKKCNLTLKWAHLPMPHRLAAKQIVICKEWLTNLQLLTIMRGRVRCAVHLQNVNLQRLATGNLQTCHYHLVKDSHIAHSQHKTVGISIHL